ncbi:DnaJ family domain-containing protein [Ornithinimicrobium pekingense]|uniref:DnaJ homologue subfamily C member 28 conserved domain-containing protein n=1 Tax=Ornithinimicrobium pekingense TaxID=384677 RepID=A0ABQ2F8B1_9MICO|nr:DnaJ family domain-containing protein [Ornithinimicrobium pekingense]GGK70558.1 hypothetical protein GCM10011509_18770 [Ornithinimicrobium pekingense]
MTDDEQQGPTWGRPGQRPGAPRAEDQLADQGVRPRPSAARTANAVATWVDQQIQQAQRQGAFDDLPGAGRPLQDVDVRTDPDWWVRGLIERENLDLSEALPGVMQLRREKAAFPDSLLDLPDEAAVRQRLEDFNDRVLADRRRPHVGPHPPPVVGRVDVEETLEAWRAARAARPAPAPEPQVTVVEPLEPRPRRRWWRRRSG